MRFVKYFVVFLVLFSSCNVKKDLTKTTIISKKFQQEK